jgi:outer membrane immunogenic protein
MKKLILSSLAFIAFASSAPAQAADMPVKARPPAAHNWSGSYVGGNVGYSWGPWDSSNPSNVAASFAGSAGFSNTASPKVDGWLGGLQIGRNWQQGQWVYGLEADIQITGERANAAGDATAAFRTPDFVFTFTGSRTNEWKFPWFATFRGRVGFTPADSWLLYATGGAALGSFKYSATSSGTVVLTTSGGGFVGAATQSLSASETATRVGWAIGGGVEKAIDKAWSVKAEYLYLDFGTRTFLTNTGLDASIQLRDHIARLGVNYKFTSY